MGVRRAYECRLVLLIEVLTLHFIAGREGEQGGIPPR